MDGCSKWTASARLGLEEVKSELAKEQVNGKEYWMVGDARERRAYDASRAYLLPGWDCHLLDYKDLSAVLAAEHALKIVSGNNGIFFPTMDVAGQVIGTWKRRLKKNALEIILHHFIDLEASEESVMQAAKE